MYLRITGKHCDGEEVTKKNSTITVELIAAVWNKNTLDFGKKCWISYSVDLLYQEGDQQAANDKHVQVPLQWENIGIKLGDQTQQLPIVLHYNTECKP